MNSNETSARRRLLRFVVIAGSIGIVHFIVISIAISEAMGGFDALGGPLTWTEQLAWAVTAVLGFPLTLLPNQWREQFSGGVMLGTLSLSWGVAGYLLIDFLIRWRDPSRRQSVWRFRLISLVVMTTLTAIVLGLGSNAHTAAKQDEDLQTEWEERGVLVGVHEGRVFEIFPGSDADLTQLIHCPEVKVLVASNTTDIGLRELRHTPTLTDVVLIQSTITDNGIVHLLNLQNLQSLSLISSNVTDAGLAQLKPLPTLTNLDLSYTSVTDESVPHLARFNSLEQLKLYGTGVTEEARERLRRALPNCRVDD